MDLLKNSEKQSKNQGAKYLETILPANYRIVINFLQYPYIFGIRPVGNSVVRLRSTPFYPTSRLRLEK